MPFVSRVTSLVYVIVLRVYLKLFDKRLYFSLCTSEEKKSKYFSYSDSFIIDHNQPNSFLKGKVSNRLDTWQQSIVCPTTYKVFKEISSADKIFVNKLGAVT